MRALQLTAWKQNPEFREVTDLEPDVGEVVVRIGGAGACHSDLHLIHDFEPGLLAWGPPFTLGHENAGWVDAVGGGVTGLEIGQPVAVYGPWGCGACHRCRQGLENYCERQAELGAAGGGLGDDGGMAPRMLVPSARHLVPLGDLEPHLAAPLTDAGLTPYHAVKRSLGLLGAGSTAVVIGVGGLGHMGVQILETLCAATIVAVDERESALTRAEAAGADRTVLAGPDALGVIQGITGGRGADVVLDFVGVDATLQLGAAALRPLGHLTLVGIGGGSYPFGFFTVPYEVALATTYWGSLPELMEVVALAEAGRIASEVTTYALDDAPQAYEDLHAAAVAGRAVIVP